jgi:hypothetical protein
VDSDILKWFGFLASIVLAGGLGYSLFVLIGGMAKRLEGRTFSPVMADEVAILQDQVAEVDVLRERIGALEERLDFAERLLTSSTRAPSDAERPT